MDYLALSDSDFARFTDKLSSEEYRKIFNNDPEGFADRINGGRTWEEHRDRKEQDALNKQIADMVDKDLAAKNKKLRSRLDSGVGLDAQLCTWLDLPTNIPIMPIPTAGFSGAGLAAIKAAARAFMAKHASEGRFSEDEQYALMKTMTDACNVVGRMFDPRTTQAWEAVYKICLMAGRVRPMRLAPEPTPEPTMAERISKIAAEPTPEEKRISYRNTVVFKSRSLGDLTAYDIERKLTADQYKQIIAEGYSKDGQILLNTQELTQGKKIEYRPATVGISTGVK